MSAWWNNYRTTAHTPWNFTHHKLNKISPIHSNLLQRILDKSTKLHLTTTNTKKHKNVTFAHTKQKIEHFRPEHQKDKLINTSTSIFYQHITQPLTNKPPFLLSYLHKVNVSPTTLSLCNTLVHDTTHFFICTHK